MAFAICEKLVLKQSRCLCVTHFAEVRMLPELYSSAFTAAFGGGTKPFMIGQGNLPKQYSYYLIVIEMHASKQ